MISFLKDDFPPEEPHNPKLSVFKEGWGRLPLCVGVGSRMTWVLKNLTDLITCQLSPQIIYIIHEEINCIAGLSSLSYRLNTNTNTIKLSSENLMWNVRLWVFSNPTYLLRSWLDLSSHRHRTSAKHGKLRKCTQNANLSSVSLWNRSMYIKMSMWVVIFYNKIMSQFTVPAS